MTDSPHIEHAIFAAGCFWGVEARFRTVTGVIDTEVGYTGGTTENPDYRSVCSGRTGHAEACRVAFDSRKTEYKTLLQAFWAMHDPTQKNRQGPDIGTQYRSALFCTTAEQEKLARQSLSSVQAEYKKPIATEIGPAQRFWPAEEYHQHYLEKQGLR